MSEKSLPADVPEPSWDSPTGFEEAVPRADPGGLPITDNRPPSNVVLATAGIGALNVVLTIAFAVLWMAAEDMALTVLRASSIIWVLSGIVAIGLGAYVQREQKRSGYKGGTAGTAAVGALISGALIISVSLTLPMLSAMRDMLSPGG